MHIRWRAPVALTTAVVLAFFVYRVAEHVQHAPNDAVTLRSALLNPGALEALSDLLRAVAPTDELSPSAGDGAAALLAGLQSSAFLRLNPQLELNPPGDLSDLDLEGITGLIGSADSSSLSNLPAPRDRPERSIENSPNAGPSSPLAT